ncbi:nuclear transport factor 2 family protein [Microbispora sp. H10830]|uniref:nuclear transport factor 2 family protein n=1 Tax=Microbispora sp. H10830 TaxID=2729109 RepID=UPI001602ACBF
MFTASGRLTRPNGASLVGSEAIAAGQSESFARFRATHHVSSDHVIDLDGDSARLRANLIAMHLWGRPETRSQYAAHALPRRRGAPRCRAQHRPRGG